MSKSYILSSDNYQKTQINGEKEIHNFTYRTLNERSIIKQLYERKKNYSSNNSKNKELIISKNDSNKRNLIFSQDKNKVNGIIRNMAINDGNNYNYRKKTYRSLSMNNDNINNLLTNKFSHDFSPINISNNYEENNNNKYRKNINNKSILKTKNLSNKLGNSVISENLPKIYSGLKKYNIESDLGRYKMNAQIRKNPNHSKTEFNNNKIINLNYSIPNNKNLFNKGSLNKIQKKSCKNFPHLIDPSKINFKRINLNFKCNQPFRMLKKNNNKSLKTLEGYLKINNINKTFLNYQISNNKINIEYNNSKRNSNNFNILKNINNSNKEKFNKSLLRNKTIKKIIDLKKN